MVIFLIPGLNTVLCQKKELWQQQSSLSPDGYSYRKDLCVDYFNGGSTEYSSQPTLLLKHARRRIHRLLHQILIFPLGFQWNQLNINLLFKVQSDRIKGKSLFTFIFWKKYCFFQEGKTIKPSYYWRSLHVMFALSLYYFSSRLRYNILWIKSLHLLSPFFSEWIFYLSSETTGWYYQSCVSWESVAGLNFLFSLLLLEHTDLRGKLSALICLQILTGLP